MAKYMSIGGRIYALDLEIVKSPATSSRTSQTTSSLSSTLSESSNSQLAISTRKPRAPRKRLNQTYNEAAALLSTAYPNLFSTQNLAKPWKPTKPPHFFSYESPEMLLPFRVVDDAEFLLQTRPGNPDSLVVPRGKCLQGSDEVDSGGNFEGLGPEPLEDFDAESILDEEIEDGIDSIMGNLSVDCGGGGSEIQTGPPFSENYPMGLRFGGNLGLGLGLRAIRGVEESDWWNCPTMVNMAQINGNAEKRKKKKKVEKMEAVRATDSESRITNKPNNKLLLKLDYDEVLKAWSDGGSPFVDDTDVSRSDVPGTDFSAKLAQIDLLWDGGGLREASVLRYKGKRQSRLFSKKIRYEVRKINADQRPRMKGRFVKRSSSTSTRM